MTQRAPKLALVGAGQIGGTLALLGAMGRSGLWGEIALADLAEGTAAGKGLDIAQAGAVLGSETRLKGGAEASLKSADVVIVTAGVPRKPGMSRDDLLETNLKVMAETGARIRNECADAFVICITNPLDAMVWALREACGLPHARVVGMAGVLDASRYRHFLSQALGVAMADIHALVLGGHGDAMVALPRYTSVAGIPLQEWVAKGALSQSELEAIVARTAKGGGEIVQLLGTGSAFYAPAASASAMARAYMLDEKRLLPAAAWLQGEYGEEGVYAGVPVIVGAAGVERVVELDLNEQEKAAFQASVAGVRELIAACKERM